MTRIIMSNILKDLAAEIYGPPVYVNEHDDGQWEIGPAGGACIGDQPIRGTLAEVSAKAIQAAMKSLKIEQSAGTMVRGRGSR